MFHPKPLVQVIREQKLSVTLSPVEDERTPTWMCLAGTGGISLDNRDRGVLSNKLFWALEALGLKGIHSFYDFSGNVGWFCRHAPSREDLPSYQEKLENSFKGMMADWAAFEP